MIDVRQPLQQVDRALFQICLQQQKIRLCTRKHRFEFGILDCLTPMLYENILLHMSAKCQESIMCNLEMYCIGRFRSFTHCTKGFCFRFTIMSIALWMFPIPYWFFFKTFAILSHFENPAFYTSNSFSTLFINFIPSSPPLTSSSFHYHNNLIFLLIPQRCIQSTQNTMVVMIRCKATITVGRQGNLKFCLQQQKLRLCTRKHRFELGKWYPRLLDPNVV